MLVTNERTIDELIAETGIWKGIIQQFENDNIYFKTQLATVLSVGKNGMALEQLEHFQNRFLKMDGQITLLKHEVREQCKQLEHTATMQDSPEPLSVLLQQQLGKRIDVLEQHFETLLYDFSAFLEEHFPTR
ncbi:hypothetical protein MKQ68_09740 [Chitinophaga horti]|uniref:HPt domain-containing protein n=1 Tax=Chitinophaga horti TaxID=2920382 RepID=A0ABY6J6S0_9BACT|nr:hypothetical protein [Chitinophaga horti]UYQ95378.1 hypothetical protein MKQ68_09740 [Chitinophaga horti]